MTRRAGLVGLVAIPLALLVALAAGDVLGLARFGPSPGAIAAGAAIDALLAAALGLALRVSIGRTRAIAVGALFAIATTILLATAKTPWIALGPFGAGPLGELALIVVPVSQLLALFATAAARSTLEACAERSSRPSSSP